MKDKIAGYITGIVNNHIRIVKSMKENGYSRVTIQSHENYTNELSDLLDYVMDIPEETVTDTYAEINRLKEKLEYDWFTFESVSFENLVLKKRIEELEESCQLMCEVERNLQQKISHFEIDNAAWQKLCNELRVTNKTNVRKIKNLYSQLRRGNK